MWHCSTARMHLLGLSMDLIDNSKTSYRREWMAPTNEVSTASFEIGGNRLQSQTNRVEINC